MRHRADLLEGDALRSSSNLGSARPRQNLANDNFREARFAFCGGNRAGCKYASCRAGDTPASTETRGNQ